MIDEDLNDTSVNGAIRDDDDQGHGIVGPADDADRDLGFTWGQE